MSTGARAAFLVCAALQLGQASTDAQNPSLPSAVRVDMLVSTKVGEPRECCTRALAIAPGYATAAAKLKEIEQCLDRETHEPR
jgi:hypothetical protein